MNDIIKHYLKNPIDTEFLLSYDINFYFKPLNINKGYNN